MTILCYHKNQITNT